MPSANVVTTLFGRSVLRVSGHHALLDEVDDAVGEQLRVDAEVAVIAERGEDGVRDRADADLERRAVGDPLDDPLGDRLVTLVRHGGRDLDERLVALAPAEQLGGVDLVEALGARHPVVDLEEERYAPDQRCDVLGVGA